MWLLKYGYSAINASIKILGPIWFINLNKNIELFTIYSARQAGEFSYTTYWLHGWYPIELLLVQLFKNLIK